MDLALFRLPDGHTWLGTGPFAEHEAPPDGQVAFYVNDFALSDPRPWKTPAQCHGLQDPGALSALLNGARPPRIVWNQPVTEWFKMAFRRIRKDVLAEKLRKMVPVLSEAGQLQEGDPAYLLHRVVSSPAGLWGYGRITGDSGFLGATPELLLQVQGRRLETMALAGTAKPNDMAGFAHDAKEIEEHELVAGFLDEALSKWGTVSRSPREIRDAAGLTHFCTRLTVDLADAHADQNGLVRTLHPTPAVGCLPRNATALEKLMEYRRQLKVPAFFGAPFGLKTADAFHCVVAIRGISWSNGTVALPSGCGIVAASAFDHEWRELRLKRETVARLLGI